MSWSENGKFHSLPQPNLTHQEREQFRYDSAADLVRGGYVAQGSIFSETPARDMEELRATLDGLRVDMNRCLRAIETLIQKDIEEG